ncbi:Txe/YoeB family addiction module toxin [Niveispirillum cyanobacteriorum]|uniref:Putative mRNA interferase YoeB n=1 Tax=Niveispirillum cyanobacteriorum TaxID=1612173 RepID=A0A2K9NC88_9PROT|nr:Txe/YoeB family addiction module toxin [Niveispirillum cyanobacteriorum]AUN30166.1 Txe/YoeB family addiction module toxin [Niveispirillum cyanobacteriorum]GGE57340.1 addiction module protein [Niveispirillum cyanobacteriorum]
MKVVFSEAAWDDYLAWQAQHPEIVGRINDLLQSARRTPFTGIGKPEPLKGPLSGFWSRRITQEHRLVYQVAGAGPDQRIEVLSCRKHY